MNPVDTYLSEQAEKHFKRNKKDYPKEVQDKTAVKYDFLAGAHAAKEIYLTKGRIEALTEWYRQTGHDRAANLLAGQEAQLEKLIGEKD